MIQFFGYLPFGIIYAISRFLRFVLQFIVRYRFNTIKENLERCFPNFEENEILSILGKNYKNLATIIVEGIKGLSLSKEELMRRNQFIGIEPVQNLLASGKSVILICPHTNNWEWTVLASGYYFPDKTIGIYKEIRNSYIEKYIYTLRSRCSMQLISTRYTRLINEEIPKGRAILLMSDQNPSNTKDAIQSYFFGEKIPVLHGLEKYARQYKLPVYYLDQKRISPGYYQVSVSLLSNNSSELKETELTQLFMSKVEECIRRDPSSWLWSHRRWKHLNT
ncbi:MAG: hypothetical protein HOP11_04725 [Saprospiraceae bacterium]|nr:hypothetical protein [Saprospiraceae bacterium]